MKRNQEYYRGCLVGGAIGDALGWTIEFLSLDDIIRRFGNDGIQDFALGFSGKADFTDDTQLTLFTAEGILRAEARRKKDGEYHPASVVYDAYQRWLITQGYPRNADFETIYNGWLLGVKELHARRAPGNTCISALSSGRQGSLSQSINNSKGCGGVMRVAPAGLFYEKEKVFILAARFAALTHSHPSGYYSAGALGYIIASIIEGQNIETAVRDALIELTKYEDHEECSNCLQLALELLAKNLPDVDAIAQIGEGWVGEEALAISIYCAIKHQNNFRKAIIAAVNHSGDSDSTGAITGNLLGAYIGLSKIPKDWVEKVELSEVLLKIADDLLMGYQEGNEWWDQYPG